VLIHGPIVAWARGELGDVTPSESIFGAPQPEAGPPHTPLPVQLNCQPGLSCQPGPPYTQFPGKLNCQPGPPYIPFPVKLNCQPGPPYIPFPVELNCQPSQRWTFP